MYPPPGQSSDLLRLVLGWDPSNLRFMIEEDCDWNPTTEVVELRQNQAVDAGGGLVASIGDAPTGGVLSSSTLDTTMMELLMGIVGLIPSSSSPNVGGGVSLRGGFCLVSLGIMGLIDYSLGGGVCRVFLAEVA
ncbi:hypothetical protein L1887_25264 [Cichorium endivia]|nr:hypothetical protein L1887_25264 [Cichorium endivia]